MNTENFDLSPPRRKRKNATDRKAEIVKTTIELSAEYGPNNVTTQHLADAVGVTQPAIFRHFDTKSEIWLAVADNIGNEFRAWIDRPAVTDAADPHRAVHRLAESYFTHVAKNPAVPAIIHSRELHRSVPDFRAHIEQIVEHGRSTLAHLLRRAQDSGQQRTDIAPDDGAHVLSAMMEGIALRWSLSGYQFDLAEEGVRLTGNLIDSFRA